MAVQGRGPASRDGAATLADVARLAGVSPATASRVLTGHPHVRPDTRRLVEEAMTRLGYARHRAAWSAGTRRAGAIAFVMCEENARVFADPFFAQLLWGVSRELAAVSSQLVLLTLHSARECQTAARYLSGGHADGALFVSMHHRLPLDPGKLGIPVVLCGRPVGGAAGLPYVDADNAGGAERAVRHLLRAGRTTVATIAGPLDMGPGVDRLRGYRAAMTAAGRFDPGLVVHGDFTAGSGEQAALRLLGQRRNLDAIFAASDLMALGALRALRRAGRRVPADVAVIGFDDSPLARHADPALSTVRQPLADMAARLAQELLAVIDGTATGPAGVVLGTELILRDSS